MKPLRTAREAALQILFQQSFQENVTPVELFNSFADNFTFDDQTRDYALYLVEGVTEQQEAIKSTIEQYSENWRWDRIALIDRILLSVAIFEIKFSDKTPTAPKLCITDIIDLAKKYSSLESKDFINGILDQVYNQELSSKS